MTIMYSAKKQSLVHAAKSMSFKLVLVLAVCSWVGAAVAFGADSPVVINEFMASNNAGPMDPQGEYEDWIELYNLGETAIDVGGLYLTDDLDDPTKWQIPIGTAIEAMGYVLIWADNDLGDGGLHAAFSLSTTGEDLALFDSDGTTLLDSVSFTDQIVDISYGRYPDGTGLWSQRGYPTPGGQNVQVYEGFLAEPEFSPARGFYESEILVTLASDTPEVSIYYTTDGTEPYVPDLNGPSATATLYTEPIRIDKTTSLRAVAVRDAWKSSSVETQTYVFVADVVRQSPNHERPGADWPSGSVNGQTIDYGMDPDVVNDPQYEDLMDDALLAIPSISLVTDMENLFDRQNGIYVNAGREGRSWERPVSVELIRPDGAKGFQIDAGFRIRGGFSRSSGNPKHSFRLFFRSEYGASKLKYPLFGDEGVDEFDNIDLRTAQNYAWSMQSSNPGSKNTFVREVFCRDLQRETDQPYTRSRFYHLYLNGQYWGLYQSQERSEASYAQAYLGADSADYDVIKTDGYRTSYTDGSIDLWNHLWDLCQKGFASDEQYYGVQGKRPDMTDDPTLPVHVDLENLIDYMLGIFFTGNDDAPVTLGGSSANNFFAVRNRRVDARDGWKFFAYDCEHSLGVLRGLYDDRTGPVSAGQSRSHFNPQWLHQKLMAHPEYLMQFADHTQKHFFNNGAMTPEKAVALCLSRAQEITLAIIAESARWGDQRPDRVNRPYTQADWWAEVNGYLLDTYFPARTQIVLDQLRNRGLYPLVDAPVFHVNGAYQHGGCIASADNVSMVGGSSVWYTLDGNDPRIPGTTPEPAETVSLIAEDAPKRVLVPTGPIDDAWRTDLGFDDSAWPFGAGGVGYERSTGFEPLFDIDVQNQMYGNNTSCLVRMPFYVTAADLEGVVGLTLDVRYDDGFIACLNGTEIQRASADGASGWNASASANHSDLEAMSFVTFNVSDHLDLLSEGVNLLTIQGLNISATSSDFLISVELNGSKSSVTSPTESGVSATAVRYAGPIRLSESTRIKSRVLSGSTWSALNEAVFAVGPVAESLRISEIMYHPAGDPNAEFLELTNVGPEAINLNLVELTNGVDFTFGSVELAPADYVLVVRDVAAFEARYGQGNSIAGQYAGSLNNAGERIELVDAAGQTIQAFRFQDDWYDITDGSGFSLVAQDLLATDPNAWGQKGTWRPSAAAGGSPGFDDTGDQPALGAVVINELLANPGTGESDWIELHNTTDQAIDLGGWFLSDDVDDLAKYEIALGTSLPAGGYVVLSEDEHFGNAADPGCHAPFGLSRDGETVYLHSGADGALTGYSEQEKFDASQVGVSLGRYLKSTGTYNFVALSEPTPGTANAAPAVEPIVSR